MKNPGKVHPKVIVGAERVAADSDLSDFKRRERILGAYA